MVSNGAQYNTSETFTVQVKRRIELSNGHSMLVKGGWKGGWKGGKEGGSYLSNAGNHVGTDTSYIVVAVHLPQDTV